METATASVRLAAAALVFLANCAIAQEQIPWLVRARVVDVEPANNTDPSSGVCAADRLNASNETIPEVDISCFLTSNVAAELVLAYPQKLDVALDSNDNGSFKVLPPTLAVQYHFTTANQVRPYLGVGVNYTRISGVSLLNGAGGLNHSSIGPALQAGVDLKIDKNWSFNLDVKKVQIRDDLAIAGAKISNTQVNSLL